MTKKKYNFMKIFIENTKFIPSSGCIKWTGHIMKTTGYGRLSINGKWYFAHRFYYQYFGRYIPGTYEIDHICRNRSCVNIEHLEAVSHKINNQRGDVFHRKITHCPNGHEYNQENTTYGSHGNRVCLICRKLHTRMNRLLRSIKT